MKTRSIILSFLMIFGLELTAFAQVWGDTSPQEKAKWETDRLKNELDLSDMQTEEVERITLQKHQELSNLKMDTESMEMAERASQITSSWDSEMQAILNEDQMDEYVDVKEEFIEDDLESVNSDDIEGDLKKEGSEAKSKVKEDADKYEAEYKRDDGKMKTDIDKKSGEIKSIKKTDNVKKKVKGDKNDVKKKIKTAEGEVKMKQKEGETKVKIDD